MVESIENNRSNPCMRRTVSTFRFFGMVSKTTTTNGKIINIPEATGKGLEILFTGVDDDRR